MGLARRMRIKRIDLRANRPAGRGIARSVRQIPFRVKQVSECDATQSYASVTEKLPTAQQIETGG